MPFSLLSLHSAPAKLQLALYERTFFSDNRIGDLEIPLNGLSEDKYVQLCVWCVMCSGCVWCNLSLCYSSLSRPLSLPHSIISLSLYLSLPVNNICHNWVPLNLSQLHIPLKLDTHILSHTHAHTLTYTHTRSLTYTQTHTTHTPSNYLSTPNLTLTVYSFIH